MTVIDCAGDGRARGRAHGEAARDAVSAAIGHWSEGTAAASRRPTPLTDLVIWHHGGAMARPAESDTSYAGRDATFLVTAEASWADPEDTDTAIAWAREAWAALERHSTGGLYLNFPGLGEENEDLVRAGYGPNYERLAALKAKYDPENLFRMNLNITPAA